MKEEIIKILRKKLTNEEKAEMIFNFANMVNQANIIQMLSFAEWASTNFIRLKDFWMFKSKNKGYKSTNDLFGVWLKVRGTENENIQG
jgi:hypothetical protein